MRSMFLKRPIKNQLKQRCKTTTHHIRQLLPRMLRDISQHYSDRPDLILAAWPEVVGPKLAPMADALSFREGVLTVKITNSTLYSLLSQNGNDKARLIQSLRDKFPNTTIKTIFFRLG